MTLRSAGPIALVVVIALAPAVLPAFWITIATYVGLYTLPVLGLVLLTGIAGMTSFGQAAFVGVGAYVTAYLTTAHGVSPWLTLPAGILLTAALAFVLGSVTLRLSGHYLPLATIAWSVALYFLYGNLDLLGAHTGIGGVPAISLAGYDLREGAPVLYLTWAISLTAIWLCRNLLDSRPGRAIRALDGGVGAARAMGVDTTHYRMAAFVLSAVLACLSGWLYAHMQRFVNPTPFGLPFGIEYLFMAVIGGAGHLWGAALGALVVTLLKQRLQDVLPHLSGAAGNLEGIAFGILMIVVLHRARGGLWPAIARRLPRPRPEPVQTAPPLPARPKPAAGTPLLAVRAVEKRFGGLVAVRSLDLDVRAGEIVGLLGPNGAGKSTTFNLISGALPLTSGAVSLAGERLDTLGPERIARRGLSRTFQHVKLLAEMSVLDNVALGAHSRLSPGLFRAAVHAERADERRLRHEAARQIERVGLGSLLHAPAGSLALGQQRILEIARALAADPIILLLDEPAAGLRLNEKRVLADLLRTLRDEGLTILLVEHDMDFVMNLVDRAVVMNFGEKLAEGSPREIQADERVREAYLGSAA